MFRTISVVQAGESLTLTSEDAVAGLRMVSELVLTSSGVLKMRHALTNLREGDWQVNRFAITLPVAERAEEVMAFHGRWTRGVSAAQGPSHMTVLCWRTAGAARPMSIFRH